MARQATTIMNMENTKISERSAWLLLTTGLAMVLAWLIMRNHGLYPAIFADEWYYSKMARLQPLGEAIVPSYLYLWLFSATTACGTSFLDCTRIGNAVLLVASGPFIYLIARQVAGRGIAIALTLMCLMAPINLATAFFMPEATYYFGFIVLSWLLLTRSTWSPIRQGLAAGVVLGLLSLVKVHALFLLPAVCLFVIGAGWLRAQGAPWLRDGIIGAVLLGAMVLAVKFGIGYLLAGDAALSVFGSFYSSGAASNTSRDLGRLLGAAFINGRGHLMAMALLLPLPMATLLLWVVSLRTRRASTTSFNILCLYTFLTLGAAAGMAVAYTASIAGVGPHEVVRLHLRYYSFTFPLLIVVAAAGFSPVHFASMNASPVTRAVVATLVAAAVAASYVMLPRYMLSSIDGPEIMSIPLAMWTGQAIVGTGLLVLALWAFGKRLAAPLFLFVLLPATLALGVMNSLTYLAQIVPGWAPDRAGIAARDHVPPAERKYLTIAGNDLVEIMRAQFHVDDNDTAMLELAPGSAIEDYQLPVRNKWLLVIGEHALPPKVDVVLKTPEYALVRLAADFRPVGQAKLSVPPGADSLLASVEGLSMVEHWGRWSDSKHVVLHFNRQLPRNLDVVIKGMAYGDNTTLPFTLRAGQASTTFRLRGSMQEIRLRLTTDGTQRSLTIDVPKPMAPSATSNLPDVRELGIGIAEISIGKHGPDVSGAP
jgi:hypothetical protein